MYAGTLDTDVSVPGIAVDRGGVAVDREAALAEGWIEPIRPHRGRDDRIGPTHELKRYVAEDVVDETWTTSNRETAGREDVLATYTNVLAGAHADLVAGRRRSTDRVRYDLALDARDEEFVLDALQVLPLVAWSDEVYFTRTGASAAGDVEGADTPADRGPAPGRWPSRSIRRDARTRTRASRPRLSRVGQVRTATGRVARFRATGADSHTKDLKLV